MGLNSPMELIIQDSLSGHLTEVKENLNDECVAIPVWGHGGGKSKEEAEGPEWSGQGRWQNLR